MVKRPLGALSAALALIASLFVGLASPSPAAACTLSAHCYGLAEIDLTNWGGASQVMSRCLSVADPNTDFVDNEMWIDILSQDWNEAGVTAGPPIGATPRFFWADMRPNGGGYHEHYDLTDVPQFNQYYADLIQMPNPRAPGNWFIGIGPLTGASNNAYPADGVQVGLEVTTNNAHETGTHQSLNWWDVNSNWHVWGAGTGSGYLYANSPAEAWWGTTYAGAWNRIVGC